MIDRNYLELIWKQLPTFSCADGCFLAGRNYVCFLSSDRAPLEHDVLEKTCERAGLTVQTVFSIVVALSMRRIAVTKCSSHW